MLFGWGVEYKPHASWRVSMAAGGFLCGVALAPLIDKQLFSAVVCGIVGVVVCVVGFCVPSRFALVLLAVGGCTLGIWRGGHEQLLLSGYAQFIGRDVVVHGVVAEDTEKGNSGELRLKVKDIQISRQQLPGVVWVSASTKFTVKRSDKVVIKGSLRPGFANFPASMSFAQITQVSHIEGADLARDMRDFFTTKVREVIAEPQASLGIGFLAGQQSALPAELDEQLKVAGLTHIVVASGYNLTILVRFARRIFGKLSKTISTLLAGCMVLGFAFVTGFSPSMSRAASVAWLGLALWYYGRGIHPFVLLPCIAAVTVGVQPSFIWGDLGWYLSFGAFVGVIVLAPLVHNYFWGHKPAGILRQIVVDTACAQLVTMPIIAFSFGQYALYALPANILALPVIPLAMALTFAAGITAICVPICSLALGFLAYAVLWYVVVVAQTIADWPYAQGEITFGVELLALSYAAIALGAFLLWRRTGHNFRGDSLVD